MSSSNNNPNQRDNSGPRERGVAVRGTARGGPSGLQMSSRNVFQSLKPAKKKSKLPESEVSKDKKTVQYAKNISDIRRFELHARALADRAPDPSVLGGLFNPTTGTGYGPKKSASVSTPASDNTSKSKPRARFVDDGELATVFDDAPMIFEEPQDMNEEPQASTSSYKQSTQTSDQPTSKTTNSEKEPLDRNAAVPQRPAPKKTVSFQDYTTKLKATQFGDDTMVKEVNFGTAAKPITVAFEGINLSSSESWVKDLHASKAVVFDHMCFAKAFLQQFWEKFCIQIIHHGALMTDNKSTNTLESLQVFLSQKLAGLAYHYSDFVILVYPVGCKEWQWENIYGTSIQSKPTPTRYVVFRMSTDLASFLRLPSTPASAPTSSAAKIDFKEHRKALASSMHSLDFVNLVPAKAEPHRKFFIFFPPNSLPSPEFITAWLKACDPEREVVDCLASTMAWAKYTMEARPSPIAVMMHHSLVPIIPWLSGLRKLIVNTSTFWSVGCEPSILGVENVVAPYTATRIFPHGAAILLTPSFIVAEPRQLRDFLENFFKKYRDATPGTYKLVGCYKLQEYLLDIALEKTAERKELLAEYRHVEGDVESIAIQKGLSFVDCEARLECYILVTRMMEQENMLGYYYDWDMACPQEHTSPVVHAGDGIGQDSDEALIKWFAGWAMQYVDKHRKFIVLGSGKSASTVIRYKGDIVEENKNVSGTGTPDVENQQKPSTRSTSKAVDSSRNSPEKKSASPLSFNIPSKATLPPSKARFKNTFTTVVPKEDTSTETMDTGNSKPESDTPRHTLDSATTSSPKVLPQLDGDRRSSDSPPYSSSSMDPSIQLHHETAAASAASHAEPKIQVHTQAENFPSTGDAQNSSNPTPTSLTSAPAANGHEADESLPNHKHGRKQSLDELIAESSGIAPDSNQSENTNIIIPEQVSASSLADVDDISPKTRALSPETLILRHKLENFMVRTGTSDDLVAMQYLADADADVPNAIKLFDEDVRHRTASRTPAKTGSPRSDSTKPQARGPYPLQSVESTDEAVAAVAQTEGNAESPSMVGVVSHDGARVIPGSVRENGTPREETNIRPGFVPEENVERYKAGNKQTVSSVASPTLARDSSPTAASVASSTGKVKMARKEVIKYTSTLDWYTARIKAGKKWEHLDVLSWEDTMELVKVRSK